MKEEEAKQKAKELWGDSAFAVMHNNNYIVGENNGPFRQAYGYGSSWAKAFQAAFLNLN